MVTWPTLQVAAAVGAGTAGGVFFAFSTFVMRALFHRLPPGQSVAACKRIHKMPADPLFMACRFGPPLPARRSSFTACQAASRTPSIWSREAL